MKNLITLFLLLFSIATLFYFAKPASAGIDMDGQGNGSRNKVVANHRPIKKRSVKIKQPQPMPPIPPIPPTQR